MSSGLKRIFNCIGEYKIYVIMTPILVAIGVSTEIFLPYLMAKVIDNGVTLGLGTEYVIKLSIIMFLLVIVTLVCELIAARCASIATSGFEKNLRREIFSMTESFSQTNIDKYSTSSLVTRMTTDIINVRDAFLGLIRGFVRAPMMLIGALIMALVTKPRLSFIFLFAMPALLIARYLILKVAHPKFVTLTKCYDELNSETQENLVNIRTIKSFVNEEYAIKKFATSVAKTKDIQISVEKIMSLNMPVLRMIMDICTIFILWFGGFMVVDSKLTVGELSSFITYSVQVVGSLMMVSSIFMMMMRSRASLERIAEILNEKIDILDGKLRNSDFTDGSVEFRNVCFSYNGSNDILKDINFKIKSGETIGLIGGTGSGKSSLAKLLVHFYDINEGQIIVGGNNISDYKLDVLRENVNYVPQNSLLFSGTIKSNLLWGNESATEEDMINACKIAGAHNFIMSFQDKYDTVIGQSGVNVSGGQRQRLCIARAILRKPKILIFDDSLSAVDTITEKSIKESLTKDLPNTTKIMITQKISSLDGADRIIVLDDGKISGIGTHQELLKNSIYREIYELQSNNMG